MRCLSAFVLTALAACSISAQDAKEKQPSVSMQVEEIYVVRSVPEALTPPTGFCVQERIGFSGTRAEGRFTFRSTTTQASDGRMVDMNMKAIGRIQLCFGPIQNDIYNWYAEGALGNTPFKGNGECLRRKADFPERGLRALNCFLDLSGLPGEYVGGLLTTNSMTSLKNQGMETDPPGYTQASIATIRLWRKRDAPSNAMASAELAEHR